MSVQCVDEDILQIVLHSLPLSDGVGLGVICL